MTNKEAIETIKHAISEIEWMYPMNYAAAFDKAVEALEKQEPGWISVKDRLPDESEGRVLICYPDTFPHNQKEPFPNARHNRRVSTGCYDHYTARWYHGDMCGIGGDDPIAWMPLPEPPKEENI